MSKRLLAIALLLSLLSALRSFSQDQALTLHGMVTDDHGSPLNGASVTVRGTNIGASTDSKGEFTIKNVPSSAVLVISFQGYNEATIGVKGRGSVRVALRRLWAGYDVRCRRSRKCPEPYQVVHVADGPALRRQRRGAAEEEPWVC